MSDEEADVRLTDKDVAKLERWYEDICRVEGKKTLFWEWLKKNPGYGTNHRILGRFFNLKGTSDQAKLEYFVKVYMHQAAGDRAKDADWTVRAGIFFALAIATVAFGIDWLVGVVQNESWGFPSLVAAMVFLAGSLVFYYWSNEVLSWFRQMRSGNQIEETFIELKNMGLVQNAHRVKRKIAKLHPMLHFRAGSVFSPRAILYSLRFSNLTKDSARFAIIHEEGHLRIKQHSRWVVRAYKIFVYLIALATLIIVVPILVASVGVAIDFRIVHIAATVLLVVEILLTFVIVATMRVRHKSLETDEDNSDDLAAQTMKKAFGIRCPSRVLRTLLMELTVSQPLMHFIYSLILLLVGGDLHRNDEARVERIARLFDEPPC